MNGGQALFKALVDAGITTCFANPGTSEMQLVYEMGLSDALRPILCLQGDVVTGAEAAMRARPGQICTVIAPNNQHWDDATPPPPPMMPVCPGLAPDAIEQAASLLRNG
jgi:thiamine pyrophosphate-dependent acetolactate synthase large subunit-like protein